MSVLLNSFSMRSYRKNQYRQKRTRLNHFCVRHADAKNCIFIMQLNRALVLEKSISIKRSEIIEYLEENRNALLETNMDLKKQVSELKKENEVLNQHLSGRPA